MIELDKTLLLVDSHPNVLKLIYDYLEPRFGTILKASDWTVALDIARQHHPDMIISDITLPPTDGFDFLKEVRNDPAISKTPFLFCTAHFSSKDYDLAILLGVDSYIEKPFELQDMYIRIMNIFDKPLLIEPPSHTEIVNDVFISYNAKNVAAMNTVRDYMSKAGLRVINWHESDLDDPNRRYLSIDAIKHCWCIVAIVPLRFWEYYELEIAFKLGKPIFVILIEGEKPEKYGMFEYYYRHLTDARDDTDEVLSRLVNQIHQYLRFI